MAKLVQTKIHIKTHDIPQNFFPRSIKELKAKVHKAHDPMMEETTGATATIMAALATLTPPQLSDLTRTILSHTHHHRCRLSSLLSSPILFSLTLHRLNCLPLAHKTLLIANHLLSSLHHLTLHFQPYTNLPPRQARQRDLDAVLLLLLLCEVHQHNPQALEAPTVKWREILSDLYSDNMLTVSGIGVYNRSALVSYIEVLTRCLRFVNVMRFCCGGKAGREVAASPAVVVSLPSVVVSGGGSECVICKEEMREDRDVCELPCRHLFHWMCILRWLRKRNTCPCCRFTLPTEDVFGEIQRLWEILVKIGEKELA
ncbi:E3 ubiquitin-protein ligase SGR9, amyloplastic-like [Pyrus communis]|uniref:E3 ubiquitin-protein ligase SGR9, amyloplastic-like n=1 Tax=Pyrus communis TaxID=23211 RepID=UPI0035C09F50